MLDRIGNQLYTPCLFVRSNHSDFLCYSSKLVSLHHFLNPLFNFLQTEFLPNKFKAELFVLLGYDAVFIYLFMFSFFFLNVLFISGLLEDFLYL